MQTCQFCESSVGDRGLSPAIGAWILCIVAGLRALRTSACSARYSALYRALARAEIAGEISEFYALTMQAIFAIAEDNSFAIDYLAMADAVAETSHEHEIAGEARGTYEWLLDNPAVTTPCMQTARTQSGETMALWNEVVVALCRLGEGETSIRREVIDPQAA